MDKLLSLMKYDELRKEQSELRKKGVYRGIGLLLHRSHQPDRCSRRGVRGSRSDGCTIKLTRTVPSSRRPRHEQGQNETIMAQIAATVLASR